jgi:hypothetical protein
MLTLLEPPLYPSPEHPDSASTVASDADASNAAAVFLK